MSLEREVQLEQELADLRTALQRQQRATAKAQQKKDGLAEAVYQAARDAMRTAPPVKVPKPKPDRRRSRPEIALVHATDWQIGKQTSGYSIDVGRARISEFATKVKEITAIQRADHPVRSCHLMLGGDMVEGTSIFPGQAFEVEAHLFEQLVATASMVEQLVVDLLAEFETVDVWEEIGNHGRIGRRGEMPAGDNIDRMAYYLASQKFADEPRVVWHPIESWYQIVEIGSYRALLIHGDEIKSFGGNVPAFGILRKANAWSSGVVEPFLDAYMGHYHQIMTLQMANGGRVFVTGSPESHNEYAREFVAATGKPSQRLHFVDPDRGRVTSEHIIWLDHIT